AVPQPAGPACHGAHRPQRPRPPQDRRGGAFRTQPELRRRASRHHGERHFEPRGAGPPPRPGTDRGAPGAGASRLVSKAAKKPKAAKPVRDWRSVRSLLTVAATLVVIVGVLLGLSHLGDEARLHIGPRDRYEMRFAAIE